MTDAAAAAEAAFVAIADACAASGRFARVNRHEVKNAPSSQLTAEIWADRDEPHLASSGLATASLLITFKVRIGMGMLTEPQDAIDPEVTNAVFDVMTRLYADISIIPGADLQPLTPEGGGMFAQAGYINRDGKMFRIKDLHVPVIVFDAFPQTR